MIQTMKRLISLLVTCSVCSLMAAFAGGNASLNQAIESLNARAKTDADRKLVLKAVSQQTRLPEKTLQAQMSATHLGYGELLTANSIAEGSGKSLNAVLAMKKGSDWARLSKELRVASDSILNRLRTAEKTARTGQGAPTAQNADTARGHRQGSAYGPQAGGPAGDPMHGSH
jgi:hypothetical protein